METRLMPTWDSLIRSILLHYIGMITMLSFADWTSTQPMGEFTQCLIISVRRALKLTLYLQTIFALKS